MKKTYFTDDKNGFYGCYYPSNKKSQVSFISFLGNNFDDTLAKCGVKYLHNFNINVMAMSLSKNNSDFANYPLEKIGKAIDFLQREGNTKIGILGASTTATVALIASSYYSSLTLTIALSPSDFVMEGIHIKKGVELPSINESSITIAGIPLSFIPFYYRGIVHDKMRKEEAKKTGNVIASRYIFNEAEHYHPVTEKETIKTENITGQVIVIGAEDDSFWDTVKYIKRIKARHNTNQPKANWNYLTYKYGTNYVFPDSLVNKINPFTNTLLSSLLFKSGRMHNKECKETRMDIDRKLKFIITQWKK